MLHSDTIDMYRRMSPKERIAEMCALLEIADAALRVLPPDERYRRLDAADRLHRASIDAFFAGLRRLDEDRGNADRP